MVGINKEGLYEKIMDGREYILSEFKRARAGDIDWKYVAKGTAYTLGGIAFAVGAGAYAVAPELVDKLEFLARSSDVVRWSFTPEGIQARQQAYEVLKDAAEEPVARIIAGLAYEVTNPEVLAESGRAILSGLPQTGADFAANAGMAAAVYIGATEAVKKRKNIDLYLSEFGQRLSMLMSKHTNPHE